MKRQMYQAGGLGALREQQAIYPRINSLQTNISSAEEQLQNINQSINQVQSNLGESGENTTPIGSGFMQPVSMNNPQAPDLRAIPEFMKNPSYQPRQLAQLNVTPPQIPVALQQPLNSSPMMNTVDRRKFGFGDFVGDIVETVTKPVKKIAQKILPKEIAGPLIMAAPF